MTKEIMEETIKRRRTIPKRDKRENAQDRVFTLLSKSE